MIEYRINGKRVTKKQWDARKGAGFTPGHASMGTVAYSDSNPWISLSNGVLPSQVQEARELIEKRGLIGIEIMNNGAARCRTRGKPGVGGRNGWNEFRGRHDLDGGYGDY